MLVGRAAILRWECVQEELLDEEILNSSTRDIQARKRLMDNDLRIMKSEFQRLTHEKASMNEKIKDNLDKIENNRYRPPSFPAMWRLRAGIR